ncbi:MAG TPA: nitroreductase family protein [Acidobacteriota bacterium]|nr:nitroreductase family protein [Acidobacteriota bacterium]
MRNKAIACLIAGMLLLASPAVFSADNMEIIKLPAPQIEGGMPLMEALKLRKSTRGDFGPDMKLPMQTLSNLLWAANGVNRPGGYRTAPTAVNWRHIDIYITTADGLFLYDPDRNELKVLGRKDVREISGTQDFVKTAPLNLIYVADFNKARAPGGKGEIMPTAEVWSFAEVGAISQNVSLFCASEGLATILRAFFVSEVIEKALNLRPDQKVILTQTVAHFKK